MRIATFNINGINGRLSNLRAWLDEAKPDVVCLQELKATDADFPIAAIRELGYGAIWHGEKSWNGVAILARGATPIETRRGLPGDPTDTQSRYIEAAINGVLVGCLYVPNGNPWPGPKFDYKLRWFERLAVHARVLLATGAPVALVGDYNVMPTDLDVYSPEKWLDNALFRPEVREAYRLLVAQGWTDAVRTLHPGERDLHLLEVFPERLRARRRPAHRSLPAEPGPGRTADRFGRRSRRAQAASTRAITRRYGSNSRASRPSELTTQHRDLTSVPIPLQPPIG